MSKFSILQKSTARIAAETARIMVEEGVHNRNRAIEKAVKRLGMKASCQLPNSGQIDDAIRDRQQLFNQVRHGQTLRIRREIAQEALNFLSAYQPRLIGSTLDGSCHSHSPISLYLFPDCVENVVIDLINAKIEFTQQELKTILADKTPYRHPKLEFLVDDICVELYLIAGKNPSCIAHMETASLKKLKKIIASNGLSSS